MLCLFPKFNFYIRVVLCQINYRQQNKIFLRAVYNITFTRMSKIFKKKKNWQTICILIIGFETLIQFEKSLMHAKYSGIFPFRNSNNRANNEFVQFSVLYSYKIDSRARLEREISLFVKSVFRHIFFFFRQKLMLHYQYFSSTE